jgi:hypothetical protein
VLNLFYVTEAGTITDQQPDEVAVDLDAGAAPVGGGGDPSRPRPGAPLAGAIRDGLSGWPSGAARITPSAPDAGTGALRLRDAQLPGSVEQALELAWGDGWQPLAGLDTSVR